jgi:hypothetical protein
MTYRELQAAVRNLRIHGVCGPVNLRGKAAYLQKIFDQAIASLAAGAYVCPVSEAITAFGLDTETQGIWIQFTSSPKVYRWGCNGLAIVAQMAYSKSVGRSWAALKPKAPVNLSKRLVSLVA